MSERLFPIIDGGSIPWSLIAPHDRQAMANHGGQTLERLAERGGLSACEAIAVLEHRRWHSMPTPEARAALLAAVAAAQSQASDEIVAAAADLVRIIEAQGGCGYAVHGAARRLGELLEQGGIP